MVEILLTARSIRAILAQFQPHQSVSPNFDRPLDDKPMRRALRQLEAMPNKPRGAEIVIQYLRAWLAQRSPIVTETKILPNYPNPFNPETWMPYHLAEEATVTLTIYDATGTVVHNLNLGLKPAGVYESKEKAIYWDGRNQYGEQVSSGVYFYHFRAGDYRATKQMIILK